MERNFLDSHLYKDGVMSAQTGVQKKATSASRPISAYMKNWMQTEEQAPVQENSIPTVRR